MAEGRLRRGRRSHAARPRDLAPANTGYEHRYGVSYKQSSPLIEAGLFVDTMEVATTWDNLSRLYHEVRRTMSRHVFVMAHFSHAYRGGCSIYFTFAGFAKDHDDCLRRYRSAWRSGMDAVSRTGAAVTHHHGVGLSKAGRLYSDHQGGAHLFAPVKDAADPMRIFNPGKLWEAQ